MSTGENINANDAPLTANMVRAGFFRFPQSEIALVAPDVWPQVAPLLMAQGYPFAAREDALVPSGQVWFVNLAGVQLGRIVNVAVSMQPDKLDFVDDESNPQKTQKQRQRRVKDGLL